MVVQTTKWDSCLEQQKVPLPKIAWKMTSADTRGDLVENSPHRTPPPVPAFEKARLPRLVWLGFWEIKQKTNKQIKRCDNFQVHLNLFNTKALYMNCYSFCPLPHPQCPRCTLITGHFSLKKVKIGSNSWISRLPLWIQRNKDVIADRSSKAGCYGSK